MTITASGTMTAYATATGYSQSSSATKSCTYTEPPLDPPTISTSPGSQSRVYYIAKGPSGSTVYLSVTYTKSPGAQGPFTETVKGKGSATFIIDTDEEGFVSASAYYTLDGRTSPTAYL